jgi:hypothetical protein
MCTLSLILLPFLAYNLFISFISSVNLCVGTADSMNRKDGSYFETNFTHILTNAGMFTPRNWQYLVFFAGHYARYYLVCPLSCLAISLPYHHPGVPNVSKIITLITNLVLVLGQLSCYSRADFGSLTVQCYRNKCSALKKSTLYCVIFNLQAVQLAQ